MPRISDEEEDERERIEGQEGCLGNALALLKLTMERIDIAIRYSGQGGVLLPAMQDLQAASNLIRRAQRLAAAALKNKQ